MTSAYLDELVACVVAARMVGRVGAGEGLARRHSRVALAGVPYGACVATARPSAGTVVEAIRFAWVIVAAGPGRKKT